MNPRATLQSLQRIAQSLAANRCYACGWPLGSCKPFDCGMRYKDDTEHLAEKEGWLQRQHEMINALTELMALSSTVGASSEDADLIRLLHQRYQDSGDATARKAAWRLEELTQAPSAVAGTSCTDGEITRCADGKPCANQTTGRCWGRCLKESIIAPSTVAVANKPLPHGCYCQLGKCAAPRIMGQQMPCRDERKAAGITPNKDDEREAQSLSSSIGGKDGRCPTCLNALTPGAHALLTQIQDDRAILALIEEVEALRRGVGVTHGDGNDPAMLLKRVVGTREDVDRREAIYREAVAHGKGGWWRCYTCAPATADDNL